MNTKQTTPAQNHTCSQPLPSGTTRLSIKPAAILDVVRRRGRSWGLLAQYEEARLGLPR